jgi:anti-sigma B factor antagonist
MSDGARPAYPAHQPPDGSPAGRAEQTEQARFEFLPANGRQPATVHAVGDIDLTNAGQFQAALDEAAAASAAVTVDLTAVTYCDSAAIRALFNAARQVRLTVQVSPAGSITQTLLEVSGLDQIAAVVTLD